MATTAAPATDQQCANGCDAGTERTTYRGDPIDVCAECRWIVERFPEAT